MRFSAIIIFILLILFTLQSCSSKSIPLHPSIRHVVTEEIKPTCTGSVLVLNGKDLKNLELIVKNESVGWVDLVLPKGSLSSSICTAFGAVFSGGCDLEPSNDKFYLLNIEPTVEIVTNLNHHLNVDITISIYDKNKNILKTEKFAYVYVESYLVTDFRQVDRIVLMSFLEAARDICSSLRNL